MNGFFVYKINQKTALLEEFIYNEFSDGSKNIIAPFHPTRDSTRVKELVRLSSGEYVMSFERNFVASDHFYSTSIWLAAFKESKTMLWQRAVYIKLLGSFNSLFGHALLASGDKVFVLYNDNPDKISKLVTSDDLNAYKGLKGQIVVQEIDANGKAKKYSLLKDDEGEILMLKPKKSGRLRIHYSK